MARDPTDRLAYGWQATFERNFQHVRHHHQCTAAAGPSPGLGLHSGIKLDGVQKLSDLYVNEM